MVALSVIAIALFGVVSMILYTTKAKDAQRELGCAKAAAGKKLDEMRSQPWTTLSNLTSPAYGAFSVDGLSNPTTVDHLGKGTVTGVALQMDPLNPGSIVLVDIRVRVDWVGISGPGSYSLSGMVSQ
jgi:hypothetical protein